MIRFPPKKILVPFDLSEISMAAWSQARILARRFGAALEAVYIEEPLPVGEMQLPRPRLDADLKLEIMRHMRSKLGRGPRVHILEGSPAVVILRLARTLRPDLIVMGTHGRTGFERVWMGSVAEAVVRLSPVPVLTTRTDPRPIRSVLAPVNFTYYSDYGFLFAAGAAGAMRARLTALHVTTDPLKFPNPKFGLSNLIARLPADLRRKCRPQAEALEGDPTRAILSAARNHDLIVLVAHRKSLLKDLVLGTTAERVLRYSPVPVLAVPAPKTAFHWGRRLGAALASAPII